VLLTSQRHALEKQLKGDTFRRVILRGIDERRDLVSFHSLSLRGKRLQHKIESHRPPTERPLKPLASHYSLFVSFRFEIFRREFFRKLELFGG
jgi:hypothetical protein